MATALNQALAAPLISLKPTPFRPTPIAKRGRQHWKRWVLMAGLTVTLAVGVEFWRIACGD
jgi:hypothetical protein